MDEVGTIMLTMVGGLAIFGGGCWALFLVLRQFSRFPMNIRGHFIAAMVWTAITGFQTESLLLYRQTPNAVGHVVVYIAGWIMISSWQQFAERNHGEIYRQSSRPLFCRLLLQTLWGPLALGACVWSRFGGW